MRRKTHASFRGEIHDGDPRDSGIELDPPVDVSGSRLTVFLAQYVIWVHNAFICCALAT